MVNFDFICKLLALSRLTDNNWISFVIFALYRENIWNVGLTDLSTINIRQEVLPGISGINKRQFFISMNVYAVCCETLSKID